MSLTIKNNGKPFLPAPQGLHIARCYAVIDLGIQFNQHFNTYLPKVLIGWELPTTLMQEGKPYIQFQRYTASLSEKAHLRHLLESWRGRGFTPEELEGFHLNNLLGVPSYLSIAHQINPKSQQVYAKVVGICALPEGTVCPEPFNSLLYFDLDAYTEESFNALPESIRQKINLHRGTTKANAFEHHAEAQPLNDDDLPF